MINLFESTYRRTGIIQVVALWERLSGLKYTGSCPVKFVTKFKTEARNYQAAGGQSSSTHLMILFKQAVKDKARKWHNMVSSLSRFHEWKLEQLLQDSISSNFERIGRSDGLTKNSQADIRRVLSNTQIEKDKSPKKKQHGKGDAGKGRGKRIRCWRCKSEGHFANKCPKRNTKSSINNTNSGHVAPPAGLTNEYCVVSEDETSSINYSAKVLPQNFEDLVDLYDREMARRSVDTASQELPEIESPVGSINIAQQILSTSSLSSTTDKWLFDTGADIDATNRRINLVPEKIVDLRPKQFPVQTGSGIVFAECVGEVLLPLKGIKSERTVIRLKYVVCLKSLPLNIISGERFYRRGGYIDRNRIVNPEGRTITHIDTERRRFFLWLHGRPEPLKSVGPHKPVTHHMSSKLEVFKKSKSTTNNAEDQEFKVAYNACYTNGIFKMSDDVTRRLIHWHRRLCHPSADRLKWTIKDTIDIDLDPSDVKSLPCEACDMGKSVKFTTSSRRQRMENVGEEWHCDVGSLSPMSLEGYEYFCLTKEDVSRYRIFRALKKSEAAEELKTILSRANSELRLRHNLRPAKSKSPPSRGAGVNAQYALHVWNSQEDSQNPSLQDLPFITAGLNCLHFYITFPSAPFFTKPPTIGPGSIEC
ncbi:hypothetical protein EV44_g3800 [Erysiphe necator]|uniref:CCHC-type domain-containing protein n=1 Tax=Uncinula necator TaxID=52586 RepID=A0A0B1PB47_UNCNE|nr:hypothetical protein EV44_g3800 [Erysiphe necator]